MTYNGLMYNLLFDCTCFMIQYTIVVNIFSCLTNSILCLSYLSGWWCNRNNGILQNTSILFAARLPSITVVGLDCQCLTTGELYCIKNGGVVHEFTSLILSWVSVPRSLVLCWVFCRSLFVVLTVHLRFLGLFNCPSSISGSF